MKYKGYEIKPAEGKRIGNGKVQLFRKDYLIEEFENVNLAKEQINKHLKKYKIKKAI